MDIVLGAMITTVPRLLHDDGSRKVGTFTHFFRMPQELFHQLAIMLEPYIKKEDTAMRAAVDVKTRLGVTLRYLATGSSMSNLHYDFKLGMFNVNSTQGSEFLKKYIVTYVLFLHVFRCENYFKYRS